MILVLFIFGFIIFLFVSVFSESAKNIKEFSNNNTKNALSAFAKYESKDSVLHIYKTGPELEKAFKIVADKNIAVSHKPEEYVYTSASAGGFTVGGVDKYEAYDYVSAQWKSGKYTLEYAGETVRKITLTSDLYKDAEASSIKKYLDGINSILVMDNRNISSTNQQLIQNSLMSGGLTSANMAKVYNLSKESYPTYEKCNQIIEWLSKRIYENDEIHEDYEYETLKKSYTVWAKILGISSFVFFIIVFLLFVFIFSDAFDETDFF